MEPAARLSTRESGSDIIRMAAYACHFALSYQFERQYNDHVVCRIQMKQSLYFRSDWHTNNTRKYISSKQPTSQSQIKGNTNNNRDETKPRPRGAGSATTRKARQRGYKATFLLYPARAHALPAHSLPPLLSITHHRGSCPELNKSAVRKSPIRQQHKRRCCSPIPQCGRARGSPSLVAWRCWWLTTRKVVRCRGWHHPRLEPGSVSSWPGWKEVVM